MARGLVALAMLAALLGAPRPTSAAVNDFTEARVSPTAGTVATLFVLRVSYEGNFPATAVTVSVAGITRPMALEHGSFSDGTWALATTLPAGTWTPTFSASVLRGPSPTRVGPSISVTEQTVVAPSAPPSTAATTPRSPESVDPGGEQPASADASNVAPAATPQEAPAEAPAAEAPGSTSPTSPTGAPAVSAPRPASGDPGGGTTGDAAAASPTERPAPESAEAPVAGGPTPDPDGEGAARAADDAGARTSDRPAAPLGEAELLGTVLIIGLIGVAAVALLGTLLLAVGGRRRDAEEPATLVTGVAPEVTATDDLLTRRTLERARMRLVDDPIVSALGVERQMQARRDRRARPVATDERRPGDA